MSNRSRGRRLASGKSDETALDRRGVLQSAEHGPTSVPAEFLLEFVRALIRIHPSGDVMGLAMSTAISKVPLTEEQAEAFAKAIIGEIDQSVWPKGFF